MKFIRRALGLSSFVLSLSTQAFAACDFCSIYVAQQQRSFQPGAVALGAFEQFTSFEKLQTNGERISDPAQQFLKGSTTQLFARYEFTEDLALQGNLPIIARRFRRQTEEGVERGSESGVGDMSLNLLFSPYTFQGSEGFFRLTFQGGLKLPTGQSDRLNEESSEGEEGHHELEMEGHHYALKHAAHHHDDAAPTAIHGHDLALGSGSWDLIGGGNFFGQYGHWITAGGLQYTYRTEGDYDYRYADILIWDIGIGRYLFTSDEGTVALRLNFLGETKGMDQLSGTDVVDTGMTALFYGPELNFTLDRHIFGLLALDIPALTNNTGTMVVQDYRIRLAVLYRF